MSILFELMNMKVYVKDDLFVPWNFANSLSQVTVWLPKLKFHLYVNVL